MLAIKKEKYNIKETAKELKGKVINWVRHSRKGL